ncbi:MAG: FGGY-family carbohydrate kinase, partial [Gammaproteobacteria bacterium]
LSSFILFRLIDGNPLVVDPANASRTLLWNYRTHDWEPKLLGLFGVPDGVLPQCVPNRYDYGHLTLKARQIPVTVVSGDQSAALFALGKPRTDTTYINIGTGAFLQRPVGDKPVASAKLLGSVVWQSAAETAFVLEGTVNGAGSALQQFAAEAGLDEGELPTRIADALAASTTPPLFLNGVSGLGSPFWDAGFVSRFVGDGEAEEKLTAVIESIVFLIKANLDEMTEVTGESKQLVLTGGLSVVDGLCQRLANLSGVTVKRPQLDEATAQGMQYLLAGATGPVSETTTFQAETDKSLRLRYREWLKLLTGSLQDQ